MKWSFPIARILGTELRIHLTFFLLIAWVLFLVVKLINRLKRQEAAKEPPAPPKQEVLLAEIRDLLKARS